MNRRRRMQMMLDEMTGQDLVKAEKKRKEKEAKVRKEIPFTIDKLNEDLHIMVSRFIGREMSEDTMRMVNLTLENYIDAVNTIHNIDIDSSVYRNAYERRIEVRITYDDKILAYSLEN